MQATPQTESKPRDRQRTEPRARAWADVPGIGEVEFILTGIAPSRSPTGGKGDDGEPQTIPSYDLTFAAVLPEALTPVLLAAMRDHRLRLQPRQPDDRVSA